MVRDEYKLYRTFDLGIHSIVNRASPRLIIRQILPVFVVGGLLVLGDDIPNMSVEKVN